MLLTTNKLQAPIFVPLSFRLVVPTIEENLLELYDFHVQILTSLLFGLKALKLSSRT